MQIYDDTLAKLRSANLRQLTSKAKAEMARMLGSWFEKNMGRDSAKIREIRELSSRLLEAVEDEDLFGETIVFVNNYVAFLIVECENDLARRLLEVWVRKVKAAGNIEWILLLFSSYVELVVRTSDAKQAAQKVAKIVGLVSRHVESANRSKLSPLLLKSYCAILINHAKLILVNEESEDAVDTVKEVVKNIRKYNTVHSPDASIENLVRKIESIYAAELNKSEMAYSELSKKSKRNDDESLPQKPNYLRQSEPCESLQSDRIKVNHSAIRTTDTAKKSSQGFRIQRGKSVSRGRAASNLKKSITQKEDSGRKSLYRQFQSDEGLFEEKELEFSEIKELKETTKAALQSLIEVRRNKELLKELRVLQTSQVDTGAKAEFVGKLDKLMTMVNMQLNDIKTYNEKIDQLERLGIVRPKTTTLLTTSSKKASKEHDQDDSTSPIKNDPFVASQTSIKEFNRPGSMRQISSGFEISQPRTIKISNSAGQRSLEIRGNSDQNSEVGLDFTKTKGYSIPVLDLPPTPPMTPSNLTPIQALFFGAYHRHRLWLKAKGEELLQGSFVEKGQVYQYSFRSTFKPQDNSFTFSMNVRKQKSRKDGATKFLSEQQFLAVALVVLQYKDNYLRFTSKTPFACYLKYYLMSNCHFSESTLDFTFTSRPNSWLPQLTVNVMDHEWEVCVQHVKSGSLFILLFVDKYE